MQRNTSNEVAAILSKMNSAEEVAKFLDEMLTGAELHDLQMRWELLKLLRDGVPQRAIASKLHISLCKITRGAKILKNDSSVVRRLLYK